MLPLLCEDTTPYVPKVLIADFASWTIEYDWCTWQQGLWSRQYRAVVCVDGR